MILGVVSGLVCLLIALRLALPYAVERYVNHVLNDNPDYHGSIGRIEIALIRGAYVIHDVRIDRVADKESVPLFSADRVDLSVKWRALMHGAVVGEIDMDQPRINIVASPKGSDRNGGGADWRDTVRRLFPLRIDRLGIADGQVHYADSGAKPPVDVYVSKIEGEADNLTNSETIAKSLVARVHATGHPMGLGKAELKIALDPYADQPTFDLDFQMRDVELVKLNDFLRAYGKFDVEAGTMDAYAEIAAKEGRFDGYVKPILRDVKVTRLGEELKRGDSPVQMAWETVVGAAKGVLTNPKQKQLATRIPISGSFSNPHVSTWPAIVTALSNAFVQAISNGLDNTINWNDAPGAYSRPR